MFIFAVASTVGRDFFFGIPLLTGGSPIFEVRIGTPSSSADYVVASSTGNIATGSVMSSSTAVEQIPRSTFAVLSSGFDDRMKGIRVQATGANPIYVVAIIRYDYFTGFSLPTGYTSWLVHPNQDFQQDSYIYFVLSVDDVADPSNVLLVGSEDGTSISITPTQAVSLPQDAQSDSTLVVVAAGTTHSVTLNRFQTLGFSHNSDLTGTKIVSSSPLTVISGHECARVPNNINFCEPLYLQLPPTFSWGQVFLLAPFASRTANQFYRLVTSEDSTTIAHRCGTGTVGMENLTGETGSILSFPPGSYCYLTANSPVLVAQLAPSHNEDSVGDPAIAIVSPTSGHVAT